MPRRRTRTHKRCDVPYVNPGKPIRECRGGCGRQARPHTFFCGDDACRFWSKVQKRGPGECWLWTASCSGGEWPRTREWYGQFTLNRGGRQRHINAHVYAYTLAHGKVPKGRSVLHTCDVSKCCNPAHLYLGTQADNMRDASQRGRLHVPRPNAQKVSQEDIEEIRRLVAGGKRQVRVAERYGISATLVCLLLKGARRQYDAPLVQRKAS